MSEVNVQLNVEVDPVLRKSVALSLQLVEALALAEENYTVSFNALSMAGISLLVPFMQDNNIPLTAENFNTQYDRLVANMARAKDFVINHSQFIQGANNEQSQDIAG